MRISTLQYTWVWLRILLICFIALPCFIDSAHAQCVADFSCRNRSGCAPFTTTFTDQSTSSEGVRSWSWTFTNLETGTVLTSTAQNPQMTFNEVGPYDVSLTVECYDGQDTKTEDSYITVIYCQCNADFYASDTVGCAPLTTTFYDDSQGAVYWSWSFPGGSPSSATGQGPHTVVYNTPGLYDVTLDIECTGGSDIITKEDYILARNCTTPCEAAFDASPRQGCAPLTVNFTDQSTNAQSWQWKFPGGTPTSSTQQNPTVTYSTPGTYHVALKITCTNGQVDSLIMPNYITAEDCGEPCEAAFDASPRQGCAPLTVNFTDQSTNAQSWYWKFPGGNPATSTQQNPTVVYSTPGTYSVSLKIICTNGQVDSLIQVDYIVAEDCGEDNAAVGDWVWHDLDQNGLQDPGEPGLDSVQVSLFDQNGNLLAMTTTPSSGFYMFSNIPPGSYFINFSLRSGFVFSPQDQGTDDTIDSDAQPGSGDTPVFTLGAGENNTTMDAGMYQPEGDGEVLGHKWHDLNGNGVRDAGEPGIANWEIILDYNQDGVLDPSVDWITTTDSNGDYKFTGYFNGDYFIGEILQPGWQQTYPDTAYATHLGNVAPYDHWFYVSPNQAISGLDFGNTQSDEEYDFGDAPDPSYPTLLASNGARHVINPNLFLGSGIDPEPDGQPSGMADGDDKNIAYPGIPFPAGDEDGVQIPPIITHGSTVQVNVSASAPGVVNAWLDFNRNGSWADAGEHIIPAMPVVAGINTFSFTVPPGAVVGQSYARFRLSSVRNISFDGLAPDGEVEDYAVAIQEEGDGGNITIIKDANPKDDTPFWISVVYGIHGGAAPYRDPSMNSSTIINSPAGTYFIGENVPAGWTLTDIDVMGDADNGSSIDLNNGTVDVDLDPGEDIIITFKNKKTSEEELFDLGDAPDGTNHSGLNMNAYPGVPAHFPTVFDPATGLPQGPRHANPKADAWLGPNVSGELDADIMPDNDGLTNIDPPNNAADRDGFDDGLLFPVSLPSCKLWNIFFKVTIPPGSAGVDRYVNVWFDWNRDGDWDDTFSCHSQNDAPEWAVQNQLIWSGMPPGTYTFVSFQFLPYHPSGKEKSPIWMRITISEQRSTADAGGRGSANGFLYGETEDYYFVPSDTTEEREFDFGDAPDPSYPTLLVSNGARHVINPNLFLGSSIDPEPDGQPSGMADGDDKNIAYPGIPFPAGDEDGVQIPSIITHGSTVLVNVFSSAPGVVNAWLDFNRNGNWADAGEHIIPTMPVVAGINTFSFTVPASAVVGQSYARFRLSSVRNISFDGIAPDGEVEDYAVVIQREGDGGNITIIKDADPKDDTPFWISVVYGIHGGAAPYRDPSMNSSSITNGPAGIYSIGESVPAGWTLTDINVMGDADNGSSIDLNNGTVDVDLDPGEDITVTFRNKKTGEEEMFDLGDAPDGTNHFGASMDAYPGVPAHFPTVFDPATGLPQGPMHIQPRAQAFLGYRVSLEEEADVGPDEDPTNNIVPQNNRPDLDYHDDGVTLPLVLPDCGITSFDYRVTVAPTATVQNFYVNVWFDWNRDGDWEDIIQCNGNQAPEWAVQNQMITLSPGIHVLSTPSFRSTHPAFTGTPPPIWMRIMITTLASDTDDGSGMPNGYPFGETEDYIFVPRVTGEVEYDFGDAPDDPNAPGYPTFHANGGAYHDIIDGFHLGGLIDGETNGQPTADALGDDNVGLDDEDGVDFPTPLIPGQQATIEVVASTNGILNAWIDYNRNQSWMEPGEHIFIDVPVSAGNNPLTFTVPPTAVPGPTFARFRLSRMPGLLSTGYGHAGEVEDYEIGIEEGGEGPPIKWFQIPLLNEDPDMPYTPHFMGWDVKSMYDGTYVADDWFCKSPRPVTEIHWWGSYTDWDSAFPPPVAPHAFHIGVWTDVPVSEETDWSHPGEMIWNWIVPREMAHEHVVGNDFHPEYMSKPDTCFRYDFIIPPDEWFQQEGDSTIYWLSISALYEEEPDSFLWGWKTREHFFHDDAVYVYDPVMPAVGAVATKTEPIDEGWDLAFVLNTDEYFLEFDFGDAPWERYPTFYEHNGALHIIDPNVFLGNRIDPEPDGQPDHTCTGDDNDGMNDDDGIKFVTPTGNGATYVEVTASRPGYLNAWMDFDNNGSWAEPDDQIFRDEFIPAGQSILPVPIPSGAVPPPVFSRFRFSTEPGLSYVGIAIDGEVEDYYAEFIIDDVQNPDADATIPTAYCLYQNYPNPFNATTEISYDLPKAGHVSLSIYNLMGIEQRLLLSEQKSAGHHICHWDGKDKHGRTLPSGIYLYRLKSGEFNDIKKLILLK